MYKGFNPRKGEQDVDENDPDIAADIEELDEDFSKDVDDCNTKFHYIMTSENNGSRGKKLPDMLLLRNPFPGEALYMKKRQHPAALRFHKYKKDNDHKRFT